MRQRLSVTEAAPYLELGEAGLPEGDCEERVRLLIARSFWPYAFRDGPDDPAALDAALGAGEEAAAMAERLGRSDLASAAFDGVGSYYIAQGLYGRMANVRRPGVPSSPPGWPTRWSWPTSTPSASWVHAHVGTYREALAAADEGFARASDATMLVALDALDHRAVARFRLGDWDGMLADARQIEELLGERRDTPPGYATDHLAARAFVMEAQGDQGEANRLLERVRWLEHAEERPSPAWALWSARTLARRGDVDGALEVLGRQPEASRGFGRDYLLEARCEVAAERGDPGEMAAVAAEARAHAERAALLALRHVADRLDAAAASASGDRDRAGELLESAAGRVRRARGRVGGGRHPPPAGTRRSRAARPAIASGRGRRSRRPCRCSTGCVRCASWSRPGTLLAELR